MDKLNLEKDKKLLVETFKKSMRDLFNFLDDLLTEEEILDLAQRVKIAQQILGGKTYDEIAESVGTSTATVSKIGQVLKYGRGGLAKVFLKKIAWSKTKKIIIMFLKKRLKSPPAYTVLFIVYRLNHKKMRKKKMI